MALALFTLVIQVLIPAGFMASTDAAAPALVICTGHGPLLIGADQTGHPAKAPKPGGACAFAGHGTATVSPSPSAATATVFAAQIEAADIQADLAPGRGLAAPPPPSQGPPDSRI